MVVYIETGDYSAEFCSVYGKKQFSRYRGTPNESVTSWIAAHFLKKKKTKFETVQIMWVYLLI